MKPPLRSPKEAKRLAAGTAELIAEIRRKGAVRKTRTLQNAILNSPNFSSIATDEKGIIQIFNVGAERMLGYTSADVLNKITPADISDPQEVIARAKALSVELGTSISPGFEALVFKASRGIEDIYELTYIRKDGSRFPAIVSVTALRNTLNAIIGYLLIGTHNTAHKQVEAKASVPPQLPTRARPRTLLYIEDNPANLKLVEQIIARHPDIHLLTAVDGTKGIEIARVSKPDVILMDINLPDLNGFEALKILRADPTTAHIPVIALSANAMVSDIELGIKVGFFRYLTKPINVKEFMKTLNGALEYAEKQLLRARNTEQML
jgi:CheY-like chemotaxis protein